MNQMPFYRYFELFRDLAAELIDRINTGRKCFMEETGIVKEPWKFIFQ